LKEYAEEDSVKVTSVLFGYVMDILKSDPETDINAVSPFPMLGERMSTESGLIIPSMSTFTEEFE
jgi:hypothetical protein